jgi:hypothetical protein
MVGQPVECTIYQEFEATPENSIIAETIPDPCLTKNLITVAAKLPIVEFGTEYATAFDAWASKLEIVVENGVSMARLRDIILIEVVKLNTKIGFTLLAISPIISSFTDTAPMLETDASMLLSLIKHLRTEVAMMAALTQ